MTNRDTKTKLTEKAITQLINKSDDDSESELNTKNRSASPVHRTRPKSRAAKPTKRDSSAEPPKEKPRKRRIIRGGSDSENEDSQNETSSNLSSQKPVSQTSDSPKKSSNRIESENDSETETANSVVSSKESPRAKKDVVEHSSASVDARQSPVKKSSKRIESGDESEVKISSATDLKKAEIEDSPAGKRLLNYA